MTAVARDKESVSALDYLMFRGDSNPRTRSTVLGVEVLDHTPDWDRFLAVFDRATRTVPRLRQRILEPSLPTTAARWVVDPEFDIDVHVRRTSVPAPGSLRDVLDVAEGVMQTPLDPRRPLWSVTLVDGVKGGRAAVLLQLSHAVTDGIGAFQLFEELYDATPDEPVANALEAPAAEVLSPAELTIEGVRALPRAVIGAALSSARSLLGGAARVAASPSSALAYAQSAVRLVNHPGTASTTLAGRSLDARCTALTMPLADICGAAKAAGGSVNDAYLAGLCGALRRYHEALGAPVVDVPMAVPMSVRPDDADSGGNHFTAVNLAAPVTDPDPAGRIGIIRAAMELGRNEPALGLIDAMIPVLAAAPGAALSLMGGAMVTADVQATNIPGYPGETYLAGARVERHYGLGPLPGVAMMAVLVSRAQTCTVTVRYDLAAVRDVSAFERCLVDGFAEVLALADGEPPHLD